MQHETDHTKHQAWKGFPYLLCLFLFFFLLTGCQHLAHEPDVPSEPASNNEFGLLRDAAVSPEMPSDPVAQPPEVSVEEALPTEKAEDHTLDENPPDTPDDADIVESNIVDEDIPEKDTQYRRPAAITTRKQSDTIPEGRGSAGRT